MEFGTGDKKNFLLLKCKCLILMKFFVENFYRESDPEMHPLEIINIALIHPNHNVKSFAHFSMKM